MRILIFAALCLFASAAKAEEASTTFYQESLDKKWTVVGRVPNKPEYGYPMCMVATTFDDGSMMHITKDLERNRWYFWMHNVDWELSPSEDDNLKAQVNFFFRGKLWDGAKFPLEITAKNVARVNFPSDAKLHLLLIERLSIADTVRIIMPGNAANFIFKLPKAKKSSDFVRLFGGCVEKYNKLSAKNDMPPSSLKPGKGDRYDGATPAKSKGEKI